jgi:hypothetical protein
MADLEFKGTPFIDPGIVAPRQPKPTFRLTPTGAIADAFSVGTIFGASRSYDIPAEDGFDAWANGRLDNASSAMTFALAPSRSEAEFQQRLAHFNDMEYRRRRLADSGTEAMLISMAVETFADPTTYIPLAGVVKTAGTTLQAARRGALLGGGSALVMEGAMQGVDPGRDMLSMVTSPVFGGMIGAGAGALTYRVAQKQADAAAHLATRMEELRKMRETSEADVAPSISGLSDANQAGMTTTTIDAPSAPQIRDLLERTFPGDDFLLRTFDALPDHLKNGLGSIVVSADQAPDGLRGMYNYATDALSIFGRDDAAFVLAHEFDHRALSWASPKTVNSLYRLYQTDVLSRPHILDNAETLYRDLDRSVSGDDIMQRLRYDFDFNEWYANASADLILRIVDGQALPLNTPLQRSLWASLSESFSEIMAYIRSFGRSADEQDELLAIWRKKIDRQIRKSFEDVKGPIPDADVRMAKARQFQNMSNEEFLRLFSRIGATLSKSSLITAVAEEASDNRVDKAKAREAIEDRLLQMTGIKSFDNKKMFLPSKGQQILREFIKNITHGHKLHKNTRAAGFDPKNGVSLADELVDAYRSYGIDLFSDPDAALLLKALPEIENWANLMKTDAGFREFVQGVPKSPLDPSKASIFEMMNEAILHARDGTPFPYDMSKLRAPEEVAIRFSLSPAARQMVRPDDFRIAKTGTGIENLPITLGTRLLKYSSPTVREAGLKLISYGGFLQNEIDGKGIARVQSVEAAMSVNWHNKLASAIFAIDEGYLNYRKAVGESRVGKHVNLLVSDLIHGRNGAMSQAEFRSEVFRAMYSGDAHSNPAIADVARSLRPFFDEIGESANKQRLFTYEQRKVADWLNAEIKDLTEQLEKLKNTSADVGGAADRSRQARKAEQEKARAKDAEDGDWANQAAEEEALLNKEGALKEARIASDSAGRMSRLEQLMAPLEKRLAARQKHLDDIEAQIKRIESGGWKDLMGDKSYVPRFIDRSKVRDNIPGLRQKLTDYYTARGVKPERVEELVDEEIERLMNRSEFTPLYDDPSKIKSAHLRSREMSSELLHDYLETDIEKVMRHYVRTMTADIEISKAFGEDFDLAKTLGGIKDEYMERIKAESNPATARKLAEEMDDVMRDLRGARDLVRGTYGIPTDPDAMHWRVLKGMRTFNYLTMMGGVALSALPDVVRPIMVQGLSDTFKYGMKPLLANLDAIKMTRTESNSAALALDMVLYTRMGAFLDFGPGMGGKASAFERNLNNAGSAFSLLNLLNPWTDMIKMWSGAVIGSSMLDKTWSLGQHGNFTDETLRMLNRAGIDETTAKEISGQFAKYGDIRIGKGEAMRPLVAAAEKAGGDGKAVIEDWVDKVRAQGGVWLANTELWDNQKAAMVFRNALYEDVNRTIVTPSIGDRSLFMSTEMGRTIFQFKGFALASTQRVLVAGLQEGDSKFWTGAAAITAAGVVADYLKTEVQYRKDWSRKSTGDIIVSAIDRGGLMGIFSDANTILEKLTHNQLGARPLLGDKGKATMGSTKIGAIAGPSAQQGINFYGVLNDTLSGKSDERTATTMRMLMPGAGLFYLQPPMEALGIP